MLRASSTAFTVVVLLLVAPTAARADSTPCAPGQALPSLTATDAGGAGALYATHVLAVRTQPAGSAEILSLTAPGARVFKDDASFTLVADRAGPLGLTAVVETATCTGTTTGAVALQAPRPSVFGQFKRPRYIVPARRLYSPDPNFSFTVRLAKVGADQSPLTVRARASRRLRVPGAGTKAVSHLYPLREFELSDTESRGCELICSKTTNRGFARGVSVSARRIALKGLKVLVEPPTGYPYVVGHGERFRHTPFGVDVDVLQSGRRLARLRVAGRCDSGGQSSRCRFAKVSTKP